jgi:hypothetical protein
MKRLKGASIGLEQTLHANIRQGLEGFKGQHSSLILKILNCGRKKFYINGPCSVDLNPEK